VRNLGREVLAGIKRGLEILYGVYFGVVFLVWIVPTWVMVQFIEDHREAGRFTSSALKFLFAFLRCDVRVAGKEHMETPGAKIYASNHASYFDVLPLILGLGVPYRFIAKMEVGSMPFIGTFLKRMGHLKFDRTNPESRLRQAQKMEEFLRNGESVFVFPEGTFTSEDGVRPFQLGAFKAAVATGAPVIPVSLAGTRRFLRDGTYLPRPTSITITLSPPIYPRTASKAENSADSSDWHELIRLRDATRAAIVRYSGEPLL
jgi:1-acyl-sn-glycerol-3-phosphate acyltransferase